MPRQHIGSGSSWRYGCKTKCDASVSCKDGGVLPNIGFPWVDGMATEEGGQSFTGGYNIQTSKHASHTTHAFIHRRSFSAVIPSNHAFETVRVRWDVEEVDIHGVSLKQSYMFGMELDVSMFFGVIM